jgi:DNA-binding CsgD family transcriptional regulator
LLRFRIVDAVIALVERLCTAGPIALALDDLHWADASTVLALHRLVRRLDDLGLAILATCRPTPRSRELTQLIASLPEESAQILRLDALDDDSVASLVARLVGGEPGPELLREVGGAGGNPLFITELVGALREEDRIESVDGRAEIEGAALPPSLQLTVLRRLSLLPGDTLDLLRVASVLGSAFSLGDLSVVAGRSASDLLPRLAPALESGVLGEAGDRLSFRHDLVREAIYEDLPATARSALHLQAGRALAGARAPARQVAVHLAAGASAGDREAVEWLQRAASEAAPRDPAIAAAFFRRAVDLVGGRHPERDALGAELARSLLWSGSLEEAEIVIRELLERPQEPRLAGSLHYALGRVLAYRGRLVESIAQVDLALEIPSLPEHERASLLADVSHRRLFCGDIEGARASATEALTAGERLGNELASCSALCALSWVAAAEGRSGESVRLAGDAIPRDRNAPLEPVQFVQPRLYLGIALVDADRLEEAHEELQEGRRLSEELGTDWALPLHHFGLALWAFHAGAWDEAVAEAETSITLAEELETRVWIVAARGILAAIALSRDDFASAGREIEASERELADSGSPQFSQWRVTATKALLLEAQGDLAGALALLSPVGDGAVILRGAGPHRELAPELVRLALAAGDRERATALATAAEDATAGAELPAARATAVRCRGLLEDDPFHLLEAVAGQSESPRPYERAASCLDAGAALAGAGRGEEAVALVREGIERCEQLGATRAVARAEALLRSLGVSRGRRGARRRPESGWESLTKSEHRVAALVAEGLTNPEIGERLFVSRRTVETHVSHAFRKLGLSSRTQLAAEAARRADAEEARPSLPGPE